MNTDDTLSEFGTEPAQLYLINYTKGLARVSSTGSLPSPPREIITAAPSTPNKSYVPANNSDSAISNPPLHRRLSSIGAISVVSQLSIDSNSIEKINEISKCLHTSKEIIRALQQESAPNQERIDQCLLDVKHGKMTPEDFCNNILYPERQVLNERSQNRLVELLDLNNEAIKSSNALLAENANFHRDSFSLSRELSSGMLPKFIAVGEVVSRPTRGNSPTLRSTSP